MRQPGRERIHALRHAGEKPLVDAIMIPDTLLTLQAAARAAQSLPWLLIGSQAASCWMESRATIVIEILVPDEEQQEEILSRVEALPQGHEVRVRTAAELDVAPETVTRWHARARRDDVEGVPVPVPLPQDLFVMLLAEPGVIEAPAALYFACRLHQLHGPWMLGDVDLSPYQCQRLAEAAALLINHAADEIERLTPQLGT